MRQVGRCLSLSQIRISGGIHDRRGGQATNLPELLVPSRGQIASAPKQNRPIMGPRSPDGLRQHSVAAPNENRPHVILVSRRGWPEL